MAGDCRWVKRSEAGVGADVDCEGLGQGGLGTPGIGRPLRPKRGAILQPRATPWVSVQKTFSPERAEPISPRRIAHRTRSHFS